MENYTDILLEDQEIVEDVIGDYVSTYLKLEPADRIEAMKQFKDKLKNENVFDYDLMHRALDAEFEPLNLLKVFKKNGAFVSRAVYGNLVAHPLYNRSRKKADPILNALINLWAKVYGSDRDPNMTTITAEEKQRQATTTDRNNAIEEAKKQVAEDLAMVSGKLYMELRKRHPEYAKICDDYLAIDAYTGLMPVLQGPYSYYIEVDKNDPRINRCVRDTRKLYADKCLFRDADQHITILKIFIPLHITGAPGPDKMAKDIADIVDQEWDDIFESLKGFYNLD